MKSRLAKNIKVFLGGTCNDSKWREELIKLLKIQYFNPVVDNWDEKAQDEEIKQRKQCDYVLYVITPKMTGVYSICEVVDDSNKRPLRTLFCVLEKDEKIEFNEDQLKSLHMMKEMVKTNGAKTFNNLQEIADFLNKGV